MLSYCLKCRKNIQSKKLMVAKTNTGKLMLLTKCAVCNSVKLRFIENQKAGGLLSNLRNRAP